MYTHFNFKVLTKYHTSFPLIAEYFHICNRFERVRVAWHSFLFLGNPKNHLQHCVNDKHNLSFRQNIAASRHCGKIYSIIYCVIYSPYIFLERCSTTHLTTLDFVYLACIVFAFYLFPKMNMNRNGKSHRIRTPNPVFNVIHTVSETMDAHEFQCGSILLCV